MNIYEAEFSNNGARLDPEYRARKTLYSNFQTKAVTLAGDNLKPISGRKVGVILVEDLLQVSIVMEFHSLKEARKVFADLKE